MPKRKANEQPSEEDTGGQKRAMITENQPFPQVQLARTDTVATTATTARATRLAFRITNIPSSVTRDQFLESLDSLSHNGTLDGGGSRKNVLGCSFAPSAATADAGEFRTATVTFESIPTEFQFSGSFNHINLIADASPVIVDKHFYGLTPLNFPIRPTVEYVPPTQA